MATVDLDVFGSERDRLFGLAYRMLGIVADAEDVVQETWLRFRAATDVERPAAFLTTVATRLCLDRLKSAQRRREQYVGPWLPEPILTDRDPAHIVELDESVRLAFLHLLDRLGPVDRAVFLLHDVFGLPFAEVAAAVGKSEANCRQIARRARERVRADRPISSVNRDRTPTDDDLLERLVVSLVTDDIDELRSVLADDVVLVSDGGADQRAARRPVVGIDRAARFIATLARRGPADFTLEFVQVNAMPGLATMVDGVPVMLMAIEGSDGHIVRLHVVSNPDKLRAARIAWLESSGGDAARDVRVENPPKLVPTIPELGDRYRAR